MRLALLIFFVNSVAIAQGSIAQGMLCAGDSLSIKSVALCSPQKESELIATCLDQCGRGGCPFEIFSNDTGKAKLIGRFFGVYTVLMTQHQKCFDLSVHSQMGNDLPLQYILKFDGHMYK